MKTNLVSAAFVAASFLLMTSTASATLATCGDGTAGSGLGNVIGADCTVGGLEFLNFNVSGGTVGIDSIKTGVNGSDVNLGFQISNLVGTDIHLLYEVIGATLGIDIRFRETGTGSVTIIELACPDVNCDTVLASYAPTSTNGSLATDTALFVSSTSPVFIDKDIQFNPGSGTASLSDFVNSHIVGVPEPMTLSLMGAGLLGIGLLGRRLRR